MFFPFIIGAATMYWADRQLSAFKRTVRAIITHLNNAASTSDFQDFLQHKEDPDFKLFKEQWADFELDGKVYEQFKMYQREEAAAKQRTADATGAPA